MFESQLRTSHGTPYLGRGELEDGTTFEAQSHWLSYIDVYGLAVYAWVSSTIAIRLVNLQVEVKERTRQRYRSSRSESQTHASTRMSLREAIRTNKKPQLFAIRPTSIVKPVHFAAMSGAVAARKQGKEIDKFTMEGERPFNDYIAKYKAEKELKNNPGLQAELQGERAVASASSSKPKRKKSRCVVS